jgi:cellulose synthase (UDP-forming)
MKRRQNKNLWQFREASGVSYTDKFVLLILIMAGMISVINFAEWWFRGGHIANLTFYAILSFFFWYAMFRIVLIWINYLRLKKPKDVPKPQENLNVAIFTTSAPGEPVSMFEKTFEALNNVTYPHNTYLLDGTQDPAFKTLAEKYGIKWLDMTNVPGAKAGKINEALKCTDEDYILILDPDHIAFPNFLDQVLGFFQDEKVGFVQVGQGYYNQNRSFTASAAAEQTYTFYGPTQMGLYGYGSAVAIGANCTFRRKSLESIGGHAQGLAEDLLTSIRLHAKGWKSVYNPVIVSRGLVPEDMTSFFKQQLKWSRGTFEILFDEIPKVFGKLTFWQRIVYLSISTYYFTGTAMLFFIMVPVVYFMTGVIPGRMTFAEFIIYGTPVLIISTLIYAYIQKFLCHPETERKFHWRGMILKFSSWPVYFYGFLLALTNKKIPYLPTEKKALKGIVTTFVRPLIFYCIVFLIIVVAVYIHRRYFVPESELSFTAERVWGMLGFAFIAFIQSAIGIFAALETLWIKEDEPWRGVNVTEINNNKVYMDSQINNKKVYENIDIGRRFRYTPQ